MSRDEVNANFKYERECQPIANSLYIALGCKYKRIKGRDNKKYGDVRLWRNGNVCTVEEKFLREDLDFMFVEIMQDTETNDPGWIIYCMADFLLYMMNKKRIYICDMSRLKKFIRHFGDFYERAISRKGYGITENKKIPFSVILENEIGRKLC